MRVSYLYKLVPISYKLNSKHLKPTGIGKCSTLFTSPNYCGFLVSSRYSWVFRWSEQKIPNSWYMFQPLRFRDVPAMIDDTQPLGMTPGRVPEKYLQNGRVSFNQLWFIRGLWWNIIQYYPMKPFEATNWGTVGTVIEGSINEYGII